MSRAFLLLTVVTGSGCISNQYEIELTPQDGRLKREITAWRGDAETPEDFPEADLKRIAGAYQADVPEKRDRKHRFAGLITGRMPDDIGGHGQFIHWETSLGSLSAYVERFRGSDDLLALMDDRLKACDQFTDLLIAWLESELQNEPGFPALRKFLDTSFRRDLKNLSLHSWTFENLSKFHTPDEKDLEELIVRAGQYLVERSYFSPDELPFLSRAAWEAERSNPRPMLKLFREFIARKMNLPAGRMPESFDFLNDPAKFKNSLNGFLRTEAQTQTPDSKSSEPANVLNELLVKMFPLWIFGTADRLSVKLSLAAEPISTNGRWNPKTKQVQWTTSMLSRDAEIAEFPTLCYAFWTEPDKAEQTRRFGKVLLEGQALAEYVLWTKGLSEREAKEWNSFLSNLKPGNNLTHWLRTFRFSHEPLAQHDAEPAGLAENICKRLLNGLEPKDE